MSTTNTYDIATTIFTPSSIIIDPLKDQQNQQRIHYLCSYCKVKFNKYLIIK